MQLHAVAFCAVAVGAGPARCAMGDSLQLHAVAIGAALAASCGEAVAMGEGVLFFLLTMELVHVHE